MPAKAQDNRVQLTKTSKNILQHARSARPQYKDWDDRELLDALLVEWMDKTAGTWPARAEASEGKVLQYLGADLTDALRIEQAPSFKSIAAGFPINHNATLVSLSLIGYENG